MEASFELLSLPEKRGAQYASKGSPSLQNSSQLHGLNSSAQNQILVSTTGRSSFRSNDNSSISVKKNHAPIAVVLSKDQRVNSKLNRKLPPLLFLSNDGKKGNGSSHSQGKSSHHSQKQSTSLYAKKSISGNHSFAEKEVFQSERESSVEVEDSLGTLLSRHFEPDTTGEENGLSPNPLISKHRRISHEKSRVRHICGICSRECPSKHKLKRHLSTHTEDRPFVCDACGKTFKWIGYLQKHIRQQHSNCSIDLSPTSPMMMAPSVQSRMGSDSSIFTASPSPPHIRIHSKRHKKHKSKSKHKKSSRSRLYSESLIGSHSDACNHRRCKKSKSHKYFEDLNSVLPEPDHLTIREKEHVLVKSLIVSIPRFRNVSQDGMESPQESDPISLSMDTPSSSVEQNALPSSISNALSAIMAEPVPSNCIHAAGSRMGMQDTGNIPTQGAEFSKEYPYSFPMNMGTATNSSNTDSLLTPEYGHKHLLNTYSPQLLQQPTQSDSSTLDMSIPTANKDYSMQQQPDSQTNTGGNFSQSSNQPPDLISVPSQFNPLNTDLNFGQQLNDNMMDFSYSDPLSNQYAMYNNDTFDVDSMMDDLNALNYSPDMGMMDHNFMAAPSYLNIQQARQLLFDNSQQMRRIIRSYQTLQNTLLRVTAGAMLNSGQNYNGLVDEHGLLNSQQQHPNINNVSMEQQDQQMVLNNTGMIQPNHVTEMPQPNSQITGMQSNINQPSTQIQNYLNPAQINHVGQLQDQTQSMDQLNGVQTQLTQTPDTNTAIPLPLTPVDQMQSLDISAANNEEELLLHLQTLTSKDTDESQEPSIETTLDIFENTTCEPDDLLTPILKEQSPEEIDLSPPIERIARSDNEYDVGVQCELGPETLIALAEEEKHEEIAPDQTEEAQQQNNPLSADMVASVSPPPGVQAALTTTPTLVSIMPPALQAIMSTDVPVTPQLSHTLVSNTSERPTLIIPSSISTITTPRVTIKATEPMKIDRMVNKYRCEVEGCSRAYLHRKDLTRHIKIRHGTYVLPKVLKPVAVEAAEKPYVCSEPSCGRSYHHMRDLRRHQRNCHENNPTIQADSQASVKDNTKEYSLFGKIQLRYPCDFPGCVRSYVHKKDLVRHKRLYHKDQSSKPSVPIPLPYSNTDVLNMRNEAKQEVEQNMITKARLNSSCSSSCSSVSSTSTDRSSILSPDSLISNLNSDVFVRLGVVPPLVEPASKETPESILNSNTAQILTLIQNLTTANGAQVPDIPQLPITIPVLTGVNDNFVSNPPISSSCETLKQVLSEPTKTEPIVIPALPSVNKCPTPTSSPHEAASPVRDITSILDMSSQSFMDSLQSPPPEGMQKTTPDTLANLAVAALAKSDTDLSSLLLSTASPSPAHTPSTNSTPPTQTLIPTDCMIAPEFSSPLKSCFSPEIQLDTRQTLMDTVLAIELAEESCADHPQTLTSSEPECSILIS